MKSSARITNPVPGDFRAIMKWRRGLRPPEIRDSPVRSRRRSDGENVNRTCDTREKYKFQSNLVTRYYAGAPCTIYLAAIAMYFIVLHTLRERWIMWFKRFPFRISDRPFHARRRSMNKTTIIVLLCYIIPLLITFDEGDNVAG